MRTYLPTTWQYGRNANTMQGGLIHSLAPFPSPHVLYPSPIPAARYWVRLLASAIIFTDICTGRPNQALIFTLFLSGISLIVFRNVIPRSISSSHSSRDDSYLPLQGLHSSNALRGPEHSSSGQEDAALFPRPRQGRLLQISLAVALSLRVGILSLISYNQQCTISSLEVSWESCCIYDHTNLA